MSETNRTEFRMGSYTSASPNTLSNDNYPGVLRVFLVIAVVLVVWTISQVDRTVKLFRHIRSAPEVSTNAKSGESVMLSGAVPVDGEEAEFAAAFQSKRHGDIAFTLQWREPDFHRKNILWAKIQWMCNSEISNEDEISRTFTLRTPNGPYMVDRNPSVALPMVHNEFAYDITLGRFAKRGNSLRIDSFCANQVTVLGKLEIDPISGAKRIVGDETRPLVLINGSKESLFMQLGVTLASQLFAVSMFLVILLTPRKKTFKDRFVADPDGYFIFDLIGGAEKMAIVLGFGWLLVGGCLTWMLSNEGFIAETMTAATVAGFLILMRAARNVEYFIVVSWEEQCFYEVSRGFFWNEHKRIGKVQEVTIDTRVQPGANTSTNVTSEIVLRLPWAEPMVLSSGWWSAASAETALLPWRAFRKELLSEEARAKRLAQRQYAEDPFSGSRDGSDDRSDDLLEDRSEDDSDDSSIDDSENSDDGSDDEGDSRR